MTARIIDGKAIAQSLRASTAQAVAALAAAGRPVRLVALLIGNSPAAEVYARNQADMCAKIGIDYSLQTLPASASQENVLAEVRRLNADPAVTGVMVHLPLPEHLDTQEVQYAIDVRKDVEGVSPANIGHVVYGHTIIAPCTALAVVELIAHTGAPLQGAEAVVVGASRIAGKPISLLLTEHGATVTLCHIHTRDLPAHTRRADVLVVAVGRPGLIGVEHLRPGAVVIDVGINRIWTSDAAGERRQKTVGDVQSEAANEVAGWLSPVPGGVGPVTVAMLLKNTVRSARLVHGLEA